MRTTTQFPEATKRERIAVNKIQIGRRVLWNPIVVKEYIAQISL